MKTLKLEQGSNMKEIKLEQGSDAWLSWRKTVITATDASIIMGNNPWTTPYICWQRKLGLIEEMKSNEAMERGKHLEPEAREQFIERHGIPMLPTVVESTVYEFLGASLDGISQEGTSILEIKCGGSKLHDMAAKGEIPVYYQDQMQHQLLVTGADKCFYYSYDGKDGICIEVFPDPEFKAKFIPKARDFWRCVALNEAPALQDSDYKDMSNDPSWRQWATEYKKLCKQIKNLDETKESHRKELLKMCGNNSCLGEGIKVMKTTMRGRVDYDQIPEIKGVDLDKYRKESTTTWKILVA
jgi:putative phage-type endonuclease